MAKKELFTTGKVHIILLSIFVIILGLYLNQWWWQLGALTLFVLFVMSFYRYRSDL